MLPDEREVLSLDERAEALDETDDDYLLTVDEVAADPESTSTSNVPRSPSKLCILPEAATDIEYWYTVISIICC